MSRPLSDTSSVTDPSAPAALAARLRAHWRALAPREQALVRGAAALVAAALLWWLALAPALQTLRSAPARHAVLDAQLQHMLALQDEAERLKGTPRTDPDNAARALQAAVTERLGSAARTNVLGDRTTVTLQGAPAAALAPWLAQVRSNARAVPQEVHLVLASALPAASPASGTTFAPLSARASVRTPAPAFSAPGAGVSANTGGTGGAGGAGGAGVRWDGTLVLALPPR